MAGRALMAALVVAVVFGGWSTLLVGAVPPALATPSQQGQPADTFTLEGTVRNGTAGAVVPADLPVRVVALASGGTAQTWDGRVGAEGTYRIEGIGRVDGATYVVGTDHQGATYVERVEPPGPAGLVTRDLTIYEGAAVDPGIRFDQSALVVTGVNEAQGTVTLLEVHTLNNPTDRAFVPSMSGPGGPAGLLVFPLPANASDLTPEFGLNPSQLVQIDRGFASLTPVLPGRSEVAFSYRFPYAEQRVQLTRTIRYPLASLQVLAPAAGPQVESAQLAAADAAAVGGRDYRRSTGGPFATGTAVNLTITGLPLPGGPLARLPTGVLALGGIVVGLAAVGAAWLRAAPRGPSGALAPDEAVEEILALERAYAAGRVGEAEYRAQRQALIAAAARALGGAGPVTASG